MSIIIVAWTWPDEAKAFYECVGESAVYEAACNCLVTKHVDLIFITGYATNPFYALRLLAEM